MAGRFRYMLSGPGSAMYGHRPGSAAAYGGLARTAAARARVPAVKIAGSAGARLDPDGPAGRDSMAVTARPPQRVLPPAGRQSQRRALPALSGWHWKFVGVDQLGCGVSRFGYRPMPAR